ncbi:hypothetical protein [Kribbella deserti]|uniref:Uncharacterized protein n=1 Tax=Kribbella deserti TaxID=1926257 RepID=A0ABV6QPE9_9ACTN
MSRFARVVGAVAVSATVILGATTPLAEAITDMSVNLTMQTHPVTPNQAFGTYTAFLPTDSGWGYLYNGGSIRVDCYGDDLFSDDFLFSRTHTISSFQPLTADEKGIYLTGRVGGDLGTIWDEDTDTADHRDEVYCRMTWRDGGGGTIQRKTPVRYGYF